MIQGDDEHLAFEKYAKENNLDREMHPLHLLYLNRETAEALEVFKAGYAAAQQPRDKGKDASIKMLKEVVDACEQDPAVLSICRPMLRELLEAIEQSVHVEGDGMS